MLDPIEEIRYKFSIENIVAPYVQFRKDDEISTGCCHAGVSVLKAIANHQQPLLAGLTRAISVIL